MFNNNARDYAPKAARRMLKGLGKLAAPIASRDIKRGWETSLGS
jgi:hypothetical protein